VGNLNNPDLVTTLRQEILVAGGFGTELAERLLLEEHALTSGNDDEALRTLDSQLRDPKGRAEAIGRLKERHGDQFVSEKRVSKRALAQDRFALLKEATKQRSRIAQLGRINAQVASQASQSASRAEARRANGRPGGRRSVSPLQGYGA
jgi:hypothetical protein